MNTQEVLADRIKALEDNSHLLEKRLVAAVQTIQRLRHEITIGRLERVKADKSAADTLVAGIRDERDIVVPPQLRITKPNRSLGKKKSGGGNRTREMVLKRWALWRIQYEQGYTTRQIARAWGCNRKSLDYAKNHHWGAK